MGKITGFLEIERRDRKYAPVTERLKNFHEFVVPLEEKDLRDQAARCMPLAAPVTMTANPLTERLSCLNSDMKRSMPRTKSSGVGETVTGA